MEKGSSQAQEPIGLVYKKVKQHADDRYVIFYEFNLDEEKDEPSCQN